MSPRTSALDRPADASRSEPLFAPRCGMAPHSLRLLKLRNRFHVDVVAGHDKAESDKSTGGDGHAGSEGES